MLCFGALEEASQDIHNLVAVLAACRALHSLNLQEVPTTSCQMGLRVKKFLQRFSLAVFTFRASEGVLLARLLI